LNGLIYILVGVGVG